MPDPYLGEIRPMAYPTIPRGWLPCEGQELSIADNQALFALLRTTYGGDGDTTFRLPDLRGRVAVHPGAGVKLGEPLGEEGHALSVAEMPAHTHTAVAGTGTAVSTYVEGNVLAAGGSRYATADQLVALRDGTVANAGDGVPHENRQPWLAIALCIATEGEWPPKPEED
jgi:microcystin-dependent protein